jgi:hypothetical protein
MENKFVIECNKWITRHPIGKTFRNEHRDLCHISAYVDDQVVYSRWSRVRRSWVYGVAPVYIYAV